jgi:hypothetical protein
MTPVTRVGPIVEKLLVVCSHVEVDGDDPVWVDAGGGVDGEFPDGDVGPVDAPVPDAENLLIVRDDDQIDVVCAKASRLERSTAVAFMALPCRARRLDRRGWAVRGPGASQVALLLAVAREVVT